MIKEVKITNFLGESVVYNMQNPSIDDETGLLITEIEGLGPPKATINITDLVGTDGGLYNSSKVTNRNVVIHAYFTYAKSIEEARLMTYKFFPINKKVTFHILTEKRYAAIDGYVESIEPDIFSELATCQISIICPDAFFRSGYGDSNIRIAKTVPMFHFKYWNEVQKKETIMGKMKNTPFEEDIWYDGDTDTGFVMIIRFSDKVMKMTIRNDTTGEYMYLDTDKSGFGWLSSGWILEISTIPGKKYIKYYREDGSSAVFNLLKMMSKESSWLHITKGENRFIFNVEYGDGNFDITMKVPQLYGGV